MTPEELSRLSKEQLIHELTRLLRASPPVTAASEQQADHLLHELRVHQVELEMQNGELREVQQQLEQSRARYEELYDFAPTGYCTLDARGCIEQINLTGARYLGHPRGYLLGKPLATLSALIDKKLFLDHLRSCFRDGQEVTHEFRCSGAAGVPYYLQLVSAPVRDADGVITNCRTMLVDVSALKRATESRDHILALVSHDLRNPLQVVLMMGSMLLHEDPSARHGSAGRLAVERIHQSANAMNRLIADLMDSTQLDAGRLAIDRVPSPAAALLSDATQSLGSLVEQKSIALVAERCEQLMVSCDRGRVLQVFSNLIGNALKHTASGGMITIGCQRHGHEALFVVRDSGKGIEPDRLPHIFLRFWQERRHAEQGLGIGLSIVKGIVEAHRGRVWAESRLGEGSSFFFTLPLAS